MKLFQYRNKLCHFVVIINILVTVGVTVLCVSHRNLGWLDGRATDVAHTKLAIDKSPQDKTQVLRAVSISEENKITNATKNDTRVGSEIPERNGWHRCRQGPCSKREDCTVADPQAPDRCCSLVIEKFLSALLDFLGGKGVPYYVMFGSLLGARRDAAIIPWTSDLDVVVEANFMEVLERIHEWNNNFYFWLENRHIGRMCMVENQNEHAIKSGKPQAYVDVYVPRHFPKAATRSRVGKTIFPVLPRCIFNTSDIYGSDNFVTNGSSFTQLKIGHMVVTAPRRVDTLLNQMYTSSWINPDSSRSSHGSGWCPKDDKVYYKELHSIAASHEELLS